MNVKRLIYADPGLRDNLGHHANNCRFITREFRSRGIETRVLSFVNIDSGLQVELDARPFFRVMTPWQSDGDPICGWLNGFHIAAEATREDLWRITDIGGDDIVYLSSALPGQLMAAVQWMSSLPAERVPFMVVEFGIDPGVDLQQGPNGMTLTLRDPRVDSRSFLFRSAACRIPGRIAPRLRMITFDTAASAAFSAVMGKEVGVLPTPHFATSTPRSRSGKRPITVAVLGHQRPEKGYQLMPQVAKGLLQANADIRVLCHNADPGGMKEVQQALHALAASDRRLILDERLAGNELWPQLLDASDLIVCPYVSPRFLVSYSAVAVEAVANAIPLVVPSGSTMARLVQEFGGAGTMFERPEPALVLDATQRALDRFDRLAALADTGASLWKEIHGPRHLVDAMLAMAANSKVPQPQVVAA